MDLIDGFIARYVKEYDYYEQAARMAAQMLQSGLEAAGIRSIVTSRAKSATRLAEKCRQRNKRRPYESIEDIYSDIVDLAGVRVALYFPAERDQVGGLISRLFYEYEPRRVFPDASRSRMDRRFSGYSALHYRVRLQPQTLVEPDQRYAGANIEIQVASVLMHGWSEVEHDLVYKPADGELSAEEYSLLDQLNGLVLAGETALEQLQRAGETRVASGGRHFANHYELAAHLLSQVSTANEEPVMESGLGRVDLLFELLTRLRFDTPDDLRPYLALLHGDLERRPLSEQIIDALIAEDGSHYETYLSQVDLSRAKQISRDEVTYREMGRFLTLWVELERLLRELMPERLKQRPFGVPAMIRVLASELSLDSEFLYELDQLRLIRNQLVHGVELPTSSHIANATHQIDALISEIERRRDSQ
ncbi:MAG TPA: RelA/SpoT domain-containing protein [Chloroflexota bacterium]|nr:RelA/SpoT domain-containing protein [Chloroflexota bacterium]